MRARCRVAAVVVSFALAAAIVSAAPSADQDHLSSHDVPFQLLDLAPDSTAIVLSPERALELDDWMRRFDEWQHRIDGSEPWLLANFSGTARKPDPPGWLANVCGFLAEDGQFAKPCDLLAMWSAEPGSVQAHQAALAASRRNEVSPKSIWWQHLHMDGLWSTTQSEVGAFGLFGAHMTVGVTGRFQVFITPGILLVSVPDLYGQRQIWPATDWGVSYRLFDVRRTSVHFNLVRAWLLGTNGNLFDSNVTLVGLSVSFRPRPH